MKLFLSLKSGELTEIDLHSDISAKDIHKLAIDPSDKVVFVTDVNNNKFYIKNKEVQYYFLEINNENA